ncbi:MAG: nucleotidyltransferase family protein [Caldilineaceae bacterium]
MNQLSTMNLLLACLQETPADDLYPQLAQSTSAEWDALLALARRQGVAPLLFARLKHRGWLAALPPACQAALEAAYYENCVRNLRLYQQLNAIITRLQQQGVAVLVLKGAALATTVYADPALRMMHDLDLLVDQAQLPRVCALLQELGYAFADETSLESDLLHRHHLPSLVKADGAVAVEIHWRITPPERYQPLATGPLWARAMTTNLAGTACQTLAPTDQLLYVCLHAAYHHSFQQGVRFLCDLDAIVRRWGPALDWDSIQTQARQQGWRPGLYLTLYLAHTLLAAPIPQQVLHALQPSGFNQEIVRLARQHMFAAEEDEPKLSPAFVRMVEHSSGWARGKVLLERLFLPKHMLARLNRVSPDSYRIYGYYPRHYLGMVSRYLHHLGRLCRGDRRALVAAQEALTLRDWLAQDRGAVNSEGQAA